MEKKYEIHCELRAEDSIYFKTYRTLDEYKIIYNFLSEMMSKGIASGPYMPRIELVNVTLEKEKKKKKEEQERKRKEDEHLMEVCKLGPVALALMKAMEEKNKREA